MDQRVSTVTRASHWLVCQVLESVPYVPTGFVVLCARNLFVAQPPCVDQERYERACVRAEVLPYSKQEWTVQKGIIVMQHQSPKLSEVMSRPHLVAVTIPSSYASFLKWFKTVNGRYWVAQFGLVSQDKSVRLYYGKQDGGLEFVIDEPEKNVFADDLTAWFGELKKEYDRRIMKGVLNQF